MRSCSRNCHESLQFLGGGRTTAVVVADFGQSIFGQSICVVVSVVLCCVVLCCVVLCCDQDFRGCDQHFRGVINIFVCVVGGGS